MAVLASTFPTLVISGPPWLANLEHVCDKGDPLCKDCHLIEICPGCDVPLQPTSGGKKQCRRCGFLLTCCD